MNGDEKALFKAINQHLQKAGDTIALSDIHDGNWLFACVNPTDPFSSMEPEAITVKNVKVRNRETPRSNEGSWGLYFIYENDEIEYYAFPSNKIIADSRRGFSDERKNCEAKENAYLRFEALYKDIPTISLIKK